MKDESTRAGATSRNGCTHARDVLLQTQVRRKCDSENTNFLAASRHFIVWKFTSCLRPMLARSAMYRMNKTDHWWTKMCQLTFTWLSSSKLNQSDPNCILFTRKTFHKYLQLTKFARLTLNYRVKQKNNTKGKTFSVSQCIILFKISDNQRNSCIKCFFTSHTHK